MDPTYSPYYWQDVPPLPMTNVHAGGEAYLFAEVGGGGLSLTITIPPPEGSVAPMLVVGRICCCSPAGVTTHLLLLPCWC